MTSPEPPSLAPIATAILAALDDGTPAAVEFGDLGAPPGAGEVYGFLTRTSTRWDGSWANPHEMVTAVYQVQCVALDTDGVDTLEHLVRQALADAPVVEGWHFIDWEPLGSPGVRLDRDTEPPRAYDTPQWRFIAQPTEVP